MKKLPTKAKQAAIITAAAAVGTITFGAYKLYRAMKEIEDALDQSLHSDYDGK